MSLASKLVERLDRRHLRHWVGAWLQHRVESTLAQARRAPGTRHLLFAFCDHYEPLHGGVDAAKGRERVRAWHEGYPALAERYRDADGFHPRHSFFFPGEQYAPELLEPLAALARRGLGEVEVHLHHDGDTADELRHDLTEFLGHLDGHGHLARDAQGRLRYAFIHGNWCLANARGDGRWCGVDDELPLLFQTGCYADYTFPSAPDECQPGIVNRIYWPDGDLARRRAYERGIPARVGELRRDRLLMIEGPVALARRPGQRFGVRIESAAVTAADPGTLARVRTWVAQDVHVLGRPEWLFVKVHTHGAPDAQAASLLGAGGRTLHDALQAFNDGARWQLHYVTAREMYNIAMAAMDGRAGNPNDYRDYWLPPPPVAGR